MKSKWVSINIKIELRKSFSCQNHSQFKDSLKAVWKLQIKFREFDCLTGYSVLFFLLYETKLIFMLKMGLIPFVSFANMLFRTRVFRPGWSYSDHIWHHTNHTFFSMILPCSYLESYMVQSMNNLFFVWQGNPGTGLPKNYFNENNCKKSINILFLRWCFKNHLLSNLETQIIYLTTKIILQYEMRRQPIELRRIIYGNVSSAAYLCLRSWL